MRALWLLWITVLIFPSNEGKSLRAEQPLSAFKDLDLGNKPRLQKRSPDYYFDYDYGYNYEVEEDRTNPPPLTTTTQSPFQGFKIFLDGLKKLEDALDNPDYDWDKVTGAPKATVTDDSKAKIPSGNYSSDIHELLVLTEILKQLSLSKKHTTTTPSPGNIFQSVESILNYISQALDDRTPPEERRQILYTLAPKGDEGSVQEAVAEVSELYSKLLGEPDVSLPPPDMASLDGPAMLLNMTLRIMEEAQEEYERKTREGESHTESGINHIERLRSVIQELRSISDGLVKQATRRGEHTTRRPTTKKPSEDLCTSPFIDVAYKVCILPVLDRQLSWHDAHKYCRQRGLDLAMDSGVIKGRKYFNNQLGLIGTRERWTLWVGGRKNEQGKWLWNDGTTLPNFFWSKNQPRVYGQDSTPAGTCMAIHGFAEYYGTALPCHNRRRFICQKI